MRALVALAAATAGGTVALSGRIGHRGLCAMVSFAGGTLLGVALFALLPETAQVVGWARTPLFVTLGVLVLYSINRRLSSHCPAEHASVLEPDHGYVGMSTLLLVAVGLHSFMDGFSIAMAAHSARKALGLLVLAAVGLHKLPEGLALVSVGRQAGLPGPRALGLAVAVELTTLAGSVLGLLVGPVSELALALGLGFVAGSFLFVGAYALVEEMRDHEVRSILGWAAGGILLILGLSRTLGHAD